jgi:hypothetical protein
MEGCTLEQTIEGKHTGDDGPSVSKVSFGCPWDKPDFLVIWLWMFHVEHIGYGTACFDC